MAYVAWNCALGEAAPIITSVRPTVDLSPADDSMDTNTIVLEGAGTILSFGFTPHIVTKRLKFVPLVMAGMEGGERAPGATITLVNSQQINLLMGQQRSINQVAYGMYQSEGNSDHWNEIYFAQQGIATMAALEEQTQAHERRLRKLEARIAELEPRT